MLSILSIVLAFGAVFAVLMGWVYRYGRRKRAAAVTGLLFLIVGMPSSVSLICFLAARTREEWQALGYSVPVDWTAAVLNHGKLFQWYSINDRLALFALSVAGMVLTIVPVWIVWIPEYLLWRRGPQAFGPPRGRT